MNEIEAKRKELKDRIEYFKKAGMHEEKSYAYELLNYFNLGVKEGVEMAHKEKIHSSNLSSDFQDGYNKARKEFLDKIDKLQGNHYEENCSHCKALKELKQSLQGEKHE